MTEGQNKQPRVLVLEDEPDMRKTMVIVLRKAGYDAVGAESVQEALDAARNAAPDLVLVDIMMPGVNGLNFVRGFRATFPAPLCDVPVVALSGMDRGEWREKAFKAGCNGFMSKPVDPNELIKVVKRYTS